MRKRAACNRIRIENLRDFILLAKQNSYVGGGAKLLPYRLGSHDLQFIRKDDWAYHDSYVGENDFIGEEIVYFQNKPVWGMNYYGRILSPRVRSLLPRREGSSNRAYPGCINPVDFWVVFNTRSRISNIRIPMMAIRFILPVVNGSS